MKILYLSRINKDDRKNYGVVQKCQAQAAALRQLGHEVDWVHLGAKGIFNNDQLLHHFRQPILERRWLTYLFYFFSWLRIVSRQVNLADYDLIYIRYAMAHPQLLRLLKTARQSNAAQKIILEIPTYPYDLEPQGIVHKLSLWMDQWYRKQLKKHIDFISQYGLEKEIYGIPAIALRNGIPLQRLPLSRSIPVPGTLRLIGVANWSYWHGMDRLLLGLKKYYEEGIGEERVLLRIVGAGQALANYEALVQTYQLTAYVTFVTPKKGEALAEEFDQADMGIGCLGLFRKQVLLDSSLKTRAYCARGVPFVYSGQDLDFPEDLFFIKKVAHQEGPIVIRELVEFWKGLQAREGDWRKEIRIYAKDHLTWQQQFERSILRYL